MVYLIIPVDKTPAELGELLAGAQELLPEALDLVAPALPAILGTLVGNVSPRAAKLLGASVEAMGAAFVAWLGALRLGVVPAAELDPADFRAACLTAERYAEVGRMSLIVKGEL